MAAIPIYLEVGSKRVFACAIDWPGWTRSGKTEEDAIEALTAYAPRYQPIAASAGGTAGVGLAAVLGLTAGAGLAWPWKIEFNVVEKLRGSTTTDFGAPEMVPDADLLPSTAASRRRLAALVEATWAALDTTAAQTPPELRKGPRGGGRDRDKMIDHVLGAETSYARKLGVKHKVPQRDDRLAVAALRQDILAAIVDPPDELKWPMSYAARRIAWHVLDHAWEMEDKRT